MRSWSIVLVILFHLQNSYATECPAVIAGAVPLESDFATDLIDPAKTEVAAISQPIHLMDTAFDSRNLDVMTRFTFLTFEDAERPSKRRALAEILITIIEEKGFVPEKQELQELLDFVTRPEKVTDAVSFDRAVALQNLGLIALAEMVKGSIVNTPEGLAIQNHPAALPYLIKAIALLKIIPPIPYEDPRPIYSSMLSGARETFYYIGRHRPELVPGYETQIIKFLGNTAERPVHIEGWAAIKAMNETFVRPKNKLPFKGVEDSLDAQAKKREEILKLFEVESRAPGFRIATFAEKHSIPPGTLKNWRRNLRNSEAEGKREQFFTFLESNLGSLKPDGMVDLSKKFDVNAYTIHQWIKAYRSGHPTPPKM